MDDRFRAPLALLLDVAAVALFVVIGRAGHQESQTGFGVVLWPFVVGLAAGWAACRGWRAPFSIVRTALPAWLGTVVVGMLLRALTGQGVQPSFVVVTAIVVGALLLGWRLLRVAAARAATRGPDSSGPVGAFLRR